MRLASAPALFAATLFASGCGFVSENLDGELDVTVTVESMDTDFVNEVEIDPSTYPEVRDNCSSIEKETGQIREINIQVTTNAGHEAHYGWGEIYMRGPDGGAWPDDPPATDLVATFERVPLVDGQQVSVELTAAQKAKIARLVFTENCDKKVMIKMKGHADARTHFVAKIILVADFIGVF